MNSSGRTLTAGSKWISLITIGPPNTVRVTINSAIVTSKAYLVIAVPLELFGAASRSLGGSEAPIFEVGRQISQHFLGSPRRGRKPT